MGYAKNVAMRQEAEEYTLYKNILYTIFKKVFFCKICGEELDHENCSDLNYSVEEFLCDPDHGDIEEVNSFRIQKDEQSNCCDYHNPLYNDNNDNHGN